MTEADLERLADLAVARKEGFDEALRRAALMAVGFDSAVNGKWCRPFKEYATNVAEMLAQRDLELEKQILAIRDGVGTL